MTSLAGLAWISAGSSLKRGKHKQNLQSAMQFVLRGLKEKYELHHGVRITDSALVAAATLSNRYITDRFLPDKAIDLMDEAASKLRIEIDSLPTEIDQLERQVQEERARFDELRRDRAVLRSPQRIADEAPDHPEVLPDLAMALFAEHPEQWELLRNDPSLAPQAVEEVIGPHGLSDT